MTPAWIVEDQWRPLSPPAEIRQLGDLPRSPERLLAATRALHVLTAKRYRPTPTQTWCNIFLADICGILRAPLPHWFDLGDGQSRRELKANDIVNGLRRRRFPGWSMVGTMASQLAVRNLAAVGLPVVAVWKNPGAGSGHVVIVVPTPEGKRGVYVTGAGRHCVQECPIAEAFGRYLDQVEFYHWIGDAR